ncbi:hypothetical protein OVS_01960 [Mycoplasma ovis str. Michigan]|uniref:Uncharacterized protein n=1 Tax=Mycoplasma ovis str. Michigan TaxID=1415773 RepID=A0ABN4BR05_9MOLU|nr:hypothetical protein [Mycoplasma ovis]AHC40262.1 hypothetical protein OVS_01960 [Mycoplasma ovis str. Michigan]
MKSYVDLYKRDSKAKIFVLYKPKQELTVWKSWGQGKTWGGGYDLQYFYKFLEDKFLNDNWRTYYVSGNKTDESPSLLGRLGQRQQDQVKYKKFVYVGKWKLIELGKEPSHVIPAIKPLTKDITKDGLIDIKLERPIYWSKKLKSFVLNSFGKEDGETVEIQHYKDYLDFLGLEWDQEQGRAVFQTSVPKKS